MRTSKGDRQWVKREEKERKADEENDRMEAKRQKLTEEAPVRDLLLKLSYIPPGGNVTGTAVSQFLRRNGLTVHNNSKKRDDGVKAILEAIRERDGTHVWTPRATASDSSG